MNPFINTLFLFFFFFFFFFGRTYGLWDFPWFWLNRSYSCWPQPHSHLGSKPRL